DAFLEIRLEVQVAPAIALATPSDRFSAHLPAANPGKWPARIGGIRIFQIVHEELMGVLVASVIAFALNRLSSLALGAIVPPAVFELPDGHVLDVIALRNNRPPRFQNESIESFLREPFRGPSSGDSRTDNDGPRKGSRRKDSILSFWKQ